MSLTILLAHTGAQLEVDPRSLNSLESLKSWISRSSSIPTNRQILMTGKGKPVKLQNLLTENEIFVYDRELLSARPPGQTIPGKPRPAPSPYLPQQAPDLLTDQTSLEAWQRLFKERQAWAIQLSQAGRDMIQQISAYSAESDIIKRATIIAASNPKQHIESLHQKYDDAEKWVDSIAQDQARLVSHAQRVLNASKKITARLDLVKIISGTTVNSTVGVGTLESLFDKSAFDNANRRSTKAIASLQQRIADIRSAYEDVIHDGEDLRKQVESRLDALSEDISGSMNELSEEMTVCVRQIKADYDMVMRSARDSRSVAAISKTALLHTKKFLPSLFETVIDIGELLRKMVGCRNSIEGMALHFLQRTASVESSLASVQTQMRNVDLQPEDDAALETLGRIVQYPLIYASLLIEVVRRNEWNSKMLTDTSTLAEEMATYKEDEEKRRKKWQKSVETSLVQDTLSHRVRGIEISSARQDQNWPDVNRDDVNLLIGQLQAAEGFEEALREISEWIKLLDIPTKTQTKKANTFRNGALNESAFGKNSLMLRGNDELLTSLQNDKTKLEDRLRGSESRIRKLEDLLHRSNQMSKPFSGSSGPLNGNPQAPGMERNRSSSGVGFPISPRVNDSASRRSSVASHRLSLGQAPEEDVMLQRVLQLELELANERKRASQIEESVAKQAETEAELRRQVEDAVAMKKDLMDNFQTQQREFEAERKLLDEENRKLKDRTEELEEEFDRVVGSHDNTRGAYSELVRDHEETIENMRVDALRKLQQANDRIGNLQSVNDNQHNRLDMLEEESTRNANTIKALRQELEQRRSSQEEQHKVLHSAHISLNPDATPPVEFPDLVQHLEGLGRKAQDQNKDLQLLTVALKSQNDTLEQNFKDRERHLIDLRQNMADVERELQVLKETSAAHEARCTGLEAELERERDNTKELRAKLPGSDSVKLQLAEAEKRSESLSLQLAALQASNNQSEEERKNQLVLFEALQTTKDFADARLHARARRAAEVSLLLYLQTDRLTRLLELIGFIVTREDDSMVLQRISRTASAEHGSTTTQTMTRSVSAQTSQMQGSEPPEYLHWATSSDANLEERQFQDFVLETKAFDLDAFCDAVVKRVKDNEHHARKWQREARAYRDRYRGVQFEAQSKIAYRAFKEGDLALFLPTRSEATQKSWAAFNVGAPHYFLREQDKHRLNSRDWLLARITKVEERVVDLSKSMNSKIASGISEDGQSFEDDNPFALSDGLRWYYLDAEEERSGAPLAPGPGKTTVASAQIDAEGSIQRKKNPDQGAAARVLTKSLDSRRSSGNSRKSLIGAASSPQIPTGAADVVATDGNTPVNVAGRGSEEVRKDQMLSP